MDKNGSKMCKEFYKVCSYDRYRKCNDTAYEEDSECGLVGDPSFLYIKVTNTTTVESIPAETTSVATVPTITVETTTATSTKTSKPEQGNVRDFHISLSLTFHLAIHIYRHADIFSQVPQLQ